MLVYRVGQLVSWQGKEYRITRIVDLLYCLAVGADSETVERLPLKELKSLKESPKEISVKIDLSLLTDEEIEVAKQRLAIIEPLLQIGTKRKKADVLQVAEKEGLDETTLYRWIKRYEESGKLSSLVVLRRSDKGQSRIEDEQEEIVKLVINEYFLVQERPSVESGWNEYKSKCEQAGIKPCSKSTFARRVDTICPREKALKRKGPREAHEKHDPAVNSFNAEFPLKATQIDHTQPNVILVDDIHRKTIGRPWVTFLIDIYSRMILGFYLSLSPPSAFAVGMCMVFAMCRKEKWLAQRGIEVDYPVWGLLDNVGADNGPDFRCKSVSRSCQQHLINLTWRPLLRPEYGGHIERLIKTVKTDLSNLRGTTFQDPSHRLEYDSEGRAVFTFAEFERWLTVYICKFYHMRKHSELEMPPIKKFEAGLLGYETGNPIGLPDPIEDERRLYLDFLPYIERTVPREGVLYENTRYFHPSIARWIGVKPPYGDKHIFKYDEHQISHLYFLDPDTNDYLEIPRVRRDAPNMTRFELKQARRKLKEKGRSLVDEQALIEVHRELRAIEAGATEKTKSARRNAQRKKEAVRARAHIEVQPNIPKELIRPAGGFAEEVVEAYEDVKL